MSTHKGLQPTPPWAIMARSSSTRLTSANSGANYLRDTYAQGKANADWETIKSAYGSYPLDVIGQHLYIDQWGRTKASRIEKSVQRSWTAYQEVT